MKRHIMVGVYEIVVIIGVILYGEIILDSSIWLPFLGMGIVIGPILFLVGSWIRVRYHRWPLYFIPHILCLPFIFYISGREYNADQILGYILVYLILYGTIGGIFITLPLGIYSDIAMRPRTTNQS